MRISDWSSDVCSSDLSLEKIAFGMSDRGGIGAADDIEEHILQHVVEIGGRHAPPEIFPEQGKVRPEGFDQVGVRSEEHTSELQSLMRISYAVFCLKKKKKITSNTNTHATQTRVQYAHRRTY